MPTTETPAPPEAKPQGQASTINPGAVKPAGLPEHIKDIAKAEEPGSMAAETVISGTAWFLGDDEPDETAWEEFDLNVSGDPNNPKWVRFKIESIDRDLLQQITRDAINKDTGEEDSVLSNEYVAIQGLISPDLGDEAQWHGQPTARAALKHMFRAKGLLVDLIASRVISLSGGASKDFREVTPESAKLKLAEHAAMEVAAAGN